ncbi:hypothetical protein [Streptomyces hainanensis]|uniref:Guanylate cyclase domain-containing protein n=1 Tax=Streptomyces hainanensis TaxID=402648 RepID=A0A4R4SJH1_9ACTN|nr:hypothetical protein [Streptomyces hainanensis]TDC62182.1 hypothetical protein E1283_34550 [Streptomyces hainanensis]
MGVEFRQCWILVLDIEGFSKRTDPIQESLRAAMYEVLREALVRSGLSVDEIAMEDRGDGVLMIAPASVSPVTLAGSFVRALDDELVGKAAVFNQDHAMRFRLALHQGLAAPDARGWVGDAVNTACRLVDAGPPRAVLTAATRARMVFVVSDEIHRSVIRHGHRAIDPAAYLPIRFATKHGETITGWVTVPGYAAPPGLEETGAAEPPERAAAPSGAPTAAPARVSLSAGVVHGDQVAGDKNVTVHTSGPVRP